MHTTQKHSAYQTHILLGVAKYLTSILLTTLISLTCTAQTDKATDGLVDKFINGKMKALNIPGLAVAVIKSGEKVKISAYGVANIEWNSKVTTHTNFQIASCTKLLTSTLVLKSIYRSCLGFLSSVDSSQK